MRLWGVIAVSLVALGLCACTLGSGRMETRTVDATGVRTVEFEGVGDLTITQGDDESLTVEAESDVIGRIVTAVRGDVLSIRLRNSFWRSGTIPTRGIHYRLTVRDLNDVLLEGAGDVHIGKLNTGSLALELNGAGSVDVIDLDCDALVVRLQGAGSTTVSGKIGSQEVLVAGAGSFKAGDLASQTATIKITGAGDATVWAEQSLDATIQGVGSIRYYGDPVLSQQVNGVGQVKSLGAH